MGGPGVITVIGLDGAPLAAEAAATLAAASLVVGARRHLAAVPPVRARTIALGPLEPALDALAAHRGDAVVLASGDPGFFGILRALRDRGLECSVLPARSSVCLAFARAGLPWDDAQVVSAHGRDPRHAVNVCRAHGKVAVLTGPGCTAADLGAALEGWQRRLLIAERLGTPDEAITACAPAEAAARRWAEPNTVLVLRDEPPGERCGQPATASPAVAWPRASTPAGWALPEEDFDRSGAVITKAEVRALALARLAPSPGVLVWDVGAGCGSVGIECARFGAAVIAVEQRPRRCDLVRANSRRHHVDVRVVAGRAPAALARLPEPDAVFVGGGGPVVAEAVAARRPSRLVVALAAVERVAQVAAALAAGGYAVGGALLQAARLSPLPGDAHRLAACNPVFLLWAQAPPGPGSGRPAGHGGRP